MSTTTTNCLCIIPARGGSKRIPRKNIKLFKGKPIIAYSIELAKRSGLFETIMVSTNDPEIAKIATDFGAQVPFMRSEQNAGDHSTTADTILEVIDAYSAIGKAFDLICCIYPTAPLASLEKLKSGYESICTKDFDTVFPVTNFSFPVFRSVRRDTSGKTEMFWPEFVHTRSQDIEVAFHDAGQWYWLKQDAFVSQKKLYTENSGSIVLTNLEVQDIDNEDDWKLAELKYELLHHT